VVSLLWGACAGGFYKAWIAPSLVAGLSFLWRGDYGPI